MHKRTQSKKRTLSCNLLIINCLFAACALVAQPPPVDVPRGERLYLSNCAPCHGPRGNGGKGSDLTRQPLPRAPNDDALFAIIRRGIPGTEMPNTRHLLDRDIADVIAFVRALGRVESQSLRGDAARGAGLYRTKGACDQCHMIRGRGGRLGPELTDIGARRSPAYVRTSLVDPEADVPDNYMVYRWFTLLPDNFLQVRVTTSNGRRITGLRVNEDPFSIQIRDSADRIYSFWKSELTEIDKQWGKSPMPSYRDAFTPAELDDLVAYLMSLRGPG